MDYLTLIYGKKLKNKISFLEWNFFVFAKTCSRTKNSFTQIIIFFQTDIKLRLESYCIIFFKLVLLDELLTNIARSLYYCLVLIYFKNDFSLV
jgi:hypothetical protein